MKNKDKFRFVLQMDSGANTSYQKGQVDNFFITLESLMRHPIEKEWKIKSCDNFTGLRSMGSDIYVNDVISHVCDLADSDSDCPMFSEYGIVEFREGAYGVKLLRTERFFYFNAAPFSLDEIRVIGNKHDNPELLDGDQPKTIGQNE